jgi:hypothetical protein
MIITTLFGLIKFLQLLFRLRKALAILSNRRLTRSLGKSENVFDYLDNQLILIQNMEAHESHPL